MKRARSPHEGQRRHPQHPDTQLQTLAEWLDDHGWTYRPIHTWTWPATGKTMQLPHTNCLGTQWVIAATATAINTMNETTRHRRQERTWRTHNTAPTPSLNP